jgi:uncharacterized protein
MKIRYNYPCIDEINILDKYKNDNYFYDWYKIVRKILKSKEFQKRRLFLHHENESLWTHSIKVSFLSYKYAVKHGIDAYNCAIAGLLHDFYTKAWQYTKELEYLDDKYKEKFIKKEKCKFRELHGISHPIDAFNNSKKYYNKYLNKKVENAIVTHMFPLSLLNGDIPKYKESFVVTMIDKYVSFNISNVKEFTKYLGLKKIN